MEYTRDRVHKYIHRAVCHGHVISILLLLTLAAILIHGYHVGVEDQEVYLAAINKHLDPAAYPFNARFFTEQTDLTAFVPAVSATARLFHSVAWALFLWQAGFIFLILWGCWKLAALCFADERARWSGVLLVTVLLTLPIAGTRLYPLDQYLHPRAPAVCGILWALVASLEKRWLRAAACLLFAALMHPLMALFGASLLLFVSWPARGIRKIAQMAPATAMVLPFQLFHKHSDAWREAAQARTYYFLLQWTWYEWLGMVAPVLLVWWFARIARRHGMTTLELVASRLVLFAIFQFAIGVLLTLSPATEQLASFQPMRWLHIFYFLFLLMAGGLIGQFLLRGKVWRWLILFLPLAGTMFYVQRDSFRYSDHIELPGRAPKNPWAKAFLWPGCLHPQECRFRHRSRLHGAACRRRLWHPCDCQAESAGGEPKRSWGGNGLSRSGSGVARASTRATRHREALTAPNFIVSKPATTCRGRFCRPRRKCRWSVRTAMRQPRSARWNSYPAAS